MKKGILICARTGSTRLPEKMIADVNGEPVIKYLIKRLQKSKYCDEIVFCTTHLKGDDVLEEIVAEMGVPCYRGSVEDKMDRWYKAAIEYDIDYFVNVDGDDLFCEPELIDLAFVQQENDNHDFVKCDEPKLVAGIFTFGMKTSALKRLCEIKTTTDTEATWLSFYDMIGLRSEMLQNIPHIYYRPEIRATLDYEEDLLFFRKIINYFGDSDYSLRDIVLYLDENPEISDINLFRHKDYLENQKKLNRTI